MAHTRTIERLHEKNIKATPQRIAVLEYLESGCIHPSVEEIYNTLRNKLEGISLATVYNTVECLVKLEEANKICIADDRARYEAKRTSHHHFYCKECGTIFDIDVTCPHLKTMQAGAHKIEEIHGYFKGICKTCLHKTKS